MSVGVLLLLLGGSAIAASTVQVEATLRVAGVTRFMGHANATAHATGILYDTRTVPGNLTLEVWGQSARLRILNLPYVIAGSRGGPAGRQEHAQALPLEELANSTFSGRLRLVESFENGTFRLFPADRGGLLDVPLGDGPEWTISPPQHFQAPLAIYPDAVRAAGRPLNPPDGGWLVPSESNGFRFQGGLLVFLQGGDFVLEPEGGAPRHVWSGQRLNQSRTVTDPSGTVGSWYYDRIVIFLDGPNLQADVRGGPPGRLGAAVASMDGSWDGDFAFSNVGGEVTADGNRLPTNQTLFQTIGNFQGGGRFDDESGAALWTVAGPARFVAVDGRTLAGVRSLAPNPAAVAGGITLLAALALFFTHAGRELLTFVSGRNIASPLGHPTRVQMLRLIAQRPGVTQSQLAAECGLNLWVARHHLRILKRGGFLDVVRHGSADAFLLNGATYRFHMKPEAREGIEKAPEESRVFVPDALAALNHPTRRRLYELLRRIGPAHYAQVAAAWEREPGSPAPRPRDLTYHAARLERVGLLRRVRQGRRVAWSTTIDVEAALQHQRERLLKDRTVRRVQDLMARRPDLGREQLVARLSRRASRSAVEGAIHVMEATGMVPSLSPSARATEAA